MRHSITSSGPAARWIAPSTPPPPSSEVLAALTIASTSWRVMSPRTMLSRSAACIGNRLAQKRSTLGRPMERDTADLFAAGLAPLDLPPRLLMGSGPSNPEPRVLRALANPPLAADDPALAPLLDAITRGLQGLF